MKNHLTGLLALAAIVLPSCAGNSPPVAAPAVPRVVLVHGFLENGNTFKPLKKRLEKRGFDVYAPNSSTATAEAASICSPHTSSRTSTRVSGLTPR